MFVSVGAEDWTGSRPGSLGATEYRLMLYPLTRSLAVLQMLSAV
jgi:hypothetical protein